MLYQLSYGGNVSGAEGARTPDLSVANAALSQLSYGPIARFFVRPLGRDGMDFYPSVLRVEPFDQYLVGATGFEPVTSTMST